MVFKFVTSMITSQRARASFLFFILATHRVFTNFSFVVILLYLSHVILQSLFIQSISLSCSFVFSHLSLSSSLSHLLVSFFSAPLSSSLSMYRLRTANNKW